MGIAERFKKELNEVNIFQQNNVNDEITNFKDVYDISNPIESGKKEWNDYSFGDIEYSILNKIKKTPYWNEYSIALQQNMIGKYFDAKIKFSKNNDLDLEKTKFVERIINLIK